MSHAAPITPDSTTGVSPEERRQQALEQARRERDERNFEAYRHQFNGPAGNLDPCSLSWCQQLESDGIHISTREAAETDRGRDRYAADDGTNLETRGDARIDEIYVRRVTSYQCPEHGLNACKPIRMPADATPGRKRSINYHNQRLRLVTYSLEVQSPNPRAFRPANQQFVTYGATVGYPELVRQCKAHETIDCEDCSNLDFRHFTLVEIATPVTISLSGTFDEEWANEDDARRSPTLRRLNAAWNQPASRGRQTLEERDATNARIKASMTAADNKAWREALDRIPKPEYVTVQPMKLRGRAAGFTLKQPTNWLRTADREWPRITRAG